MTEQLFLKQFSQLPENLKKELLDFLEFLVLKYQNKQAGKQQKQEEKKPEKEHKSASEEAGLIDMQHLLLKAPDMTDEEYNFIMGKRKTPKAGFLKGTFVMSPDFDEPLEDFKEYMA